jgi:hypothetical protein
MNMLLLRSRAISDIELGAKCKIDIAQIMKNPYAHTRRTVTYP